ncbi:Late embryogenesis abundant protein [Carex littledalei]|uniref:Late embryogenesis abundant protein n=1 Tax=Carex littledalei TaxID=544730 RepID=A0A833VCW9_9POAL|nr:Late embryogenesis abundant protein [Carex littledalei]
MLLKDKPESPDHLNLQPSAPPQPPLPLYASTKTTEPSPTTPKRKRKKLICFILLGIITVLITLFLFTALYLFKKRAVQVTTNNATLERLTNSITPITLDLVIGVNIGIKNPNYAGFNYESTDTKIFYHGIEAGISPMLAGVVKARSSKKLHSTVYMNATVMISTPFLLPELTAGNIPLSSSTSLVGEIVLFNIIKIHATVETSCNITVNLQTSTTTADCKGDVKIS